MDNLAVVAGAGGFIGRHLASYLHSLGLDVLALDRLPVELPGVRAAGLDLTDRAAVLTALAGCRPRWVFNLTGVIDHTIAWPEQRDLMNQHWLSMLNLIESLDNRRPEAFVNIGSSDEYGAQPPPQREEMREMPIAPYSAAKVAATHYLQMWHRRTGFPGIVARFFLVYGPGQDARRLIPWACTTLLKGETMPASPGLQQRDFLYVSDAAEALVKLAETPAAQGGVFNVASGQPVSVRRVLETVQIAVRRGAIDFGAYPMREGEAMALYADVNKIHNVTGWQPRIPLKEGIAETVKFYERMGVNG
jgi:nucleoside-diphosphate-sugar epimerase